MRRLFEQVTAGVSRFIKQRDQLLLLIPCNDSDFALVLKALRDLDRRSASELFLLFADDFETPKQFVGSMAQSLKTEWGLVNGAVAENERLTPLPATFLDDAAQPPARLESGLVYAHSQI